MTEQVEPCPECDGSGEVTKAGSVEVNEFGKWDRDTVPCPGCRSGHPTQPDRKMGDLYS